MKRRDLGRVVLVSMNNLKLLLQLGADNSSRAALIWFPCKANMQLDCKLEVFVLMFGLVRSSETTESNLLDTKPRASNQLC